MGLVDLGGWPLVIVHWPAGLATPEEVDEILEQLTRLYGQKHAVLHDGVRGGGLSAEGRQRVTAHSAQHEEEVRRWVVAAVAVAPSTFTRAVIKTLQWISPPPSPFRVFAARDEAREWLLQALRRAGLWRPSPAA